MLAYSHEFTVSICICMHTCLQTHVFINAQYMCAVSDAYFESSDSAIYRKLMRKVDEDSERSSISCGIWCMGFVIPTKMI